MKVAVMVSGTVRDVNMHNEEYEPLECARNLANYLNADLFCSTWSAHNDVRGLPFEELKHKIPFNLVLEPVWQIHPLAWQHFAHTKMIQLFDRDYDVIIRLRYDAKLTRNDLTLIKERVDHCFKTKETSGFVRTGFVLGNDFREFDGCRQHLNDHVIVHDAKKFDIQFALRFIELVQTVHSIADQQTIRMSPSLITKPEFLWWWLIEGQQQEITPYYNFHINEGLE